MEETRLIQLIREKRHSMHTLYIQANKNLRDEKVLAASKEIDRLINVVMKHRMSGRQKVHC
ncbi:aspartyl-phosphate phosphatase Spo0E family protein [Aneurinibacillus sp. BA2021]|nr:aspartyl-phosphate phosphatase Spo0E family protein [Aneurinibacillus sp. BA2021]